VVHAIGGGLLFYRELVRALTWPGAIMGLQAPGLDVVAGGQFDTMEGIAEQYLTVIQSYHPAHTPYCLGGSSFGGMLAYAMAQQLLARGQTVATLVLVDAPGPGVMPQRLSKDGLEKYIISQYNSVAQAPCDDQDQSNNKGTVPEWVIKTWRRHDRAMRAYQPQNMTGMPVTYVAHSEEMDNFPGDPFLPWIPVCLAAGISIHQAPGNHITMNAGAGAKSVGRLYDEALSRGCSRSTELPF
jgi:surfactin synthase thioesterase subunit